MIESFCSFFLCGSESFWLTYVLTGIFDGENWHAIMRVLASVSPRLQWKKHVTPTARKGRKPAAPFALPAGFGRIFTRVVEAYSEFLLLNDAYPSSEKIVEDMHLAIARFRALCVEHLAPFSPSRFRQMVKIHTVTHVPREKEAWGAGGITSCSTNESLLGITKNNFKNANNHRHNYTGQLASRIDLESAVHNCFYASATSDDPTERRAMGLPDGPPSHAASAGEAAPDPPPSYPHFPDTCSGSGSLAVCSAELTNIRRSFKYPGLSACPTVSTRSVPAPRYTAILCHFQKHFHSCVALFFFERWHSPARPMPAAWRQVALEFFLLFEADFEVKNALHLGPSTVIRIGGSWASHK